MASGVRGMALAVTGLFRVLSEKSATFSLRQVFRPRFLTSLNTPVPFFCPRPKHLRGGRHKSRPPLENTADARNDGEAVGDGAVATHTVGCHTGRCCSHIDSASSGGRRQPPTRIIARPALDAPTFSTRPQGLQRAVVANARRKHSGGQAALLLLLLLHVARG